VSNAYNADTAWVTVTGSGLAYPQPVAGLVIQVLGPHDIRLSWPRSDSTSTGLPLVADGYWILDTASESDSLNLIATTSDTTFVHSGIVDTSMRMFYTVIAFYSNNAVLMIERMPDGAPARRD
jgi:hypothetical protein